MQNKEKQKRLDFVKYLHDDYTIVIARHPRFSWMVHAESNYIYFLYITRSQNRFVDRETATIAKYNILCFQQVYSSYYMLMKSIYSVLSEYIMDSRKIMELLLLCEKIRDYSEPEEIVRD